MALFSFRALWRALYVMLALCSASNGHSGPADSDIRFKRWFTSGNDNNQDSIGAIGTVAEDAKGFIWLGGENGLARFDGHRLKIYRTEYDNPNSLPRNLVRDIVFDLDGVMWVATSGGLAYYVPAIDGFSEFLLDQNRTDSALSYDTSSLAVDRLNNLIVGTHIGMAIVGPDRNHIRQFRHDPTDSKSLSDDYVRTVLVDSSNQIWVGTSAGGLSKMDHQRREFVRFSSNKEDPNSLVDNDVRTLIEDHLGRIWIGTYSGGVSRLDPKTNRFVHYTHDPADEFSIGANAIREIFEDSQKRIWLATDHGGLARYRAESDDFEHFRHSDFLAHSISSDHTRSVFEDSRGDLWVGSFPSGVNFFDRTTTAFRNYSHQRDDPYSLSNSAILTFFRDSDGLLWVGTENGLNQFDTSTGRFTHIRHDASDPDALRYGTVLDIEEDIDGSLWVGTWSGGLHRYNKKTGKFKNYFVDPNNPGALLSKFVWSILLDKHGDLWVGTEKGGLSRYIRETDSFEHYRANDADPDALIDNYVWTMLEDSRGTLWLGTAGGLDAFDRETGKFQHFQPNKADPNSIKGVRAIALLEDRQGRVWVATQDEGLNLYIPHEQRFVNFGMGEGLPSNELSSLVEDDQGNIWVTTTNGIAWVDSQTFAIRAYSKDHGLVGNHFNRDASYKDEKGNIYVGGTDGISVFHPSKLASQPNASPIYLTQFEVLNQPVKLGTSDAPLQAPISEADRVTLTHKDSVFTFEFALLNYRAPHKNQYRYRLQGFDRDWVDAKSSNRASYTNLDPGSYVFQVKGASRDGVWTPQPAQVWVTVLPPPWRSWWAYLLYAAIFSAVAYYFWFSQIRRIELSKEKRVNNQLIKIDRIKDAILANTSHELRTPLHSIVGLSESLCDGVAGELSPTVIEYLRIVIGNGRKLTNLVDNILEYSNLTRSLSALNIRPVDMYSSVETAFDTVQRLKGKKPIQLINDVAKDAPLVNADESRVLQILTTLLEHALRATNEGHIAVSSHEQKNHLLISVRDTGRGLTQAQMDLAFEPFSQSEDSDEQVLGGGLGLAICKHLVDLQGGNISISSAPGLGTSITFSLPREEVLTLKSTGIDLSQRAVKISDKAADGKPRDLTDLLRIIGKPQRYTILIVDDDSVNRLVLTSMLDQFGFNTLEAASGIDALAILAREDAQVDLVILDVMMPFLSGFETCDRIRERYGYFELPVIFLTAKRLHQATIDGFCVGGNEFLTKPVAKEELVPRVINQLHSASVARKSQFRS